MTDESDFIAALDREPDDHLLRMLYADWLDERGDPRGPGYRALGVNGHWPYIPPYDHADPKCPWFTYRGRYCTGIEAQPKAALPQDWFAYIELPGRTDQFAPDHDLRTDATRREVEDAAALAFTRLPASRRAELLNPASVGASA